MSSLTKKDCSFETAVTSVDCGILEAVIAKLQLYCTLTAATLQIYCSKKNMLFWMQYLQHTTVTLHSDSHLFFVRAAHQGSFWHLPSIFPVCVHNGIMKDAENTRSICCKDSVLRCKENSLPGVKYRSVRWYKVNYFALLFSRAVVWLANAD